MPNEDFEKLILAETPTAQLTRAENGEYIVPVIQTMWRGYCMATPPAQEDDPVGYMWAGCFVPLTESMPIHRAEGRKLYTHPANDKLRKAAEEVIKAWNRGFLYEVGRKAIDNLSAALEGKSCQ